MKQELQDHVVLEKPLQPNSKQTTCKPIDQSQSLSSLLWPRGATAFMTHAWLGIGCGIPPHVVGDILFELGTFYLILTELVRGQRDGLMQGLAKRRPSASHTGSSCEPAGNVDLPPWVLAPQIKNAGVDPPEQHTSASFEFQSQPSRSCAMTPKSLRATSWANPV